MRPGIGGYVFGAIVTAIVFAVVWFTFLKGAVNKATESAGAQSAAGEHQFARTVAQVRRRVGAGGRLVTVTLRPGSAEFITSVDGNVSHGLRWQGGTQLTRFAANVDPQTGAPWPIARLDPAAPRRITRAIESIEHGSFQLSISDFQRAQTGKLVWTYRGVVGERGVAYTANPDGSGVKPYDPSSPELSSGARLAKCIQRAAGDPTKLQRCVAKFKP